MILFASSRSYPLSVVLLVPVGFCMMLQMSSSNTLIQTMVPDELRGRVMAVYSMMFMGMAPFGALVAGAVANHIGAPITVALGGLTCLAGSLIFGSRWPSMRGEAHQLIVAQGISSGEPSVEMTSQAVSVGGGKRSDQ
jgi:MFS family permease